MARLVVVTVVLAVVVAVVVERIGAGQHLGPVVSQIVVAVEAAE